jgi:predicted transcriptional regulator
MAKRLSIGTIGTKEPGRKTAKVSFSAGNDVVDRLQEIARQEDATVSRVVDRLLRAGLAIEESEAFQDHLAERLEKAVLRLESMPWGGTWKLPYNVEAEQHLFRLLIQSRSSSRPTVEHGG